MLKAFEIERGLYNTPKGLARTENPPRSSFREILSEKHEPINKIRS